MARPEISNWKRNIIAVGAAIGLAVVAACGSLSDGSSSSPDQGAASGSAATTSTTPPPIERNQLGWPIEKNSQPGGCFTKTSGTLTVGQTLTIKKGLSKVTLTALGGNNVSLGRPEKTSGEAVVIVPSLNLIPPNLGVDKLLKSGLASNSSIILTLPSQPDTEVGIATWSWEVGNGEKGDHGELTGKPVPLGIKVTSIDHHC